MAFIALSANWALAAIDDSRFDAAYEQLRDSNKFQFTLDERQPPPEAPDWLQAIANMISGFFDAMAPLIKVFFWAGIALLALGAIYLITRELFRLAKKDRSRIEDDEHQNVYRPTPTLARALLEEADRLASEHRFAEAAHVLLFKSIEDIQKHRPNSVKVAMTSREIAQMRVLTKPARASFSRIAAIVEAGRFAGVSVTPDMFAACREAYLAFASAEEWS